MSRAILLTLFLIWGAHADAVGTKKKRLLVYVRRELAPPSQCVPPVEIHQASENFHALQCKTTGAKCP